VKAADRPFGGVCVVASGDFAQLGPVVHWSVKKPFAFQHPSWTALRPILMETVLRQRDVQMVEVLGRMRLGRTTHRDCRWLVAKSSRRREHAERALFSSNKLTKARNKEMFERVDAAVVVLKPHFDVRVKEGGTMSVEQAEIRFEARLRMPNAEPLELKLGARVRCTRNVYRFDGCDRELQVANGNMGVVSGLDDHGVQVDFDDGRSLTMPKVFKYRLQRFTHEGSPVYCRALFVPLALAWATTVHTAQGASIDGPVDINPVGMRLVAGDWNTNPGLGYTAVSRATSIENVRFLKDPTPDNFKCDRAVLDFFEGAKKEAAEAK
jgi:hypothetical protein